MIARPLRHLRGHLVSYLAIFMALSGGYALATPRSQPIHGCVLNKARVLLVKPHCGRGQTALNWSARGPIGPRGRTGPQGPAPASAWALVANNGQAGPGNGITATRVATGTYQITVTAPACANRENAAVVTVSTGNPPSGQPAGSYPVAWVAGALIGPFTVYTGNSTGGTFTPADHTFNIQDNCG